MKVIALISRAILALFVVMAIGSVFAHDHARPELTPWFKQLRSGKGPCCDGSDALHIRDADWDVKDGHYRVRIPSSGDDETVATEWVDVPDEAVINEPNRDGATLVWPLYGAMGKSIRCFLPGSMT